ncbi:sensor histidine kinase [Nibricoccus aquaticus]|uniref:sensor histidine kinase n=1 Tax=Nibricoccus aquaticus TaxID=2576891 RepID=UPI0010FDC153|nr:HAMP domain-containing sensor histidine kinase [Nibricoccus aquaticus]
MTTTSRRIFLYWLLLLAAALGVGAGAWLLLEREESRLSKRTESAEAARRAAVEARAALVAENVELLVGDVEAGLLDTLAEAPAENLDAVLNDWERTNPLVRTAFRAAASSGRLLRPAIGNRSEEARGFYRRFATRLSAQPPWRPVKLSYEEFSSSSRKKGDQNVETVQNARREVQALAKDRSSYASNSAQSGSASALSGQQEAKVKGRSLSEKAEVADFAVAERAVPAAKAASVAPVADRRGWLPLVADGRLHLLGWVWPQNASEVRGVEVELAALVSRLGGAMPVEVAAGEGYALRDDKGRVQHQAGVVAASAPTVRVPLAATLLPGWDVVAFLAVAPEESGTGSFFAVGASLAAVLLLAILTSGSLLLWQARRSEAEAAQKTSFVANVSHEFKTPLTTIRLYSELLEQGRVADAEKQGEYLRTIGRETQRLARLVNNALDFSRLEQGKKQFQRERCDLGAELGRLMDVHAPRVAESGMTLRGSLPEKPVMVTTDRDAVEQIVLNLVDNACKYASDGRELSVALVGRADGGAEVRVSDRGPGVPVSERERIFEKFHRVDQTLTAEKGGTGLGLSIARQLARGLGGELRCEARPGGGAVFVLTLP